MGVLSKIGGFLNRHRNKFVVGGALVAGTVLLSRYAQHKFHEWQQNEAKEFFERTRKQQHFESTERTCNRTIVQLAGSLCESLDRALDTESIVAQLRTKPDDRVQLWEELRTLVFAKATCLAYASTLLVVMLRVQVNVLAGFLYRDTTVLTARQQEKYLSLCQCLLNEGIENVARLLKTECGKILGSVPFKKQMKIGDVENLFWAVQEAVKGRTRDDPVKSFSRYLVVAESSKESYEDDLYASMLTDTIDLLKSEEVTNLTSSCISRSFVLLVDKIAEFYTPSSEVTVSEDSGGGDAAAAEFVHPSDLRIPLAKLIPIINGLVSKKNSLPDALIQQLTMDDKLKTLGANIYEAFSYDNNNVA